MPKYHINIGLITDVPNIAERFFVTAWQDNTEKVLTTRFATWDVLIKEFRRLKVLVRELGEAEKSINDTGSWTSPLPILLDDEQLVGLKLKLKSAY